LPKNKAKLLTELFWIITALVEPEMHPVKSIAARQLSWRSMMQKSLDWRRENAA
jgi:hypothetical protein